MPDEIEQLRTPASEVEIADLTVAVLELSCVPELSAMPMVLRRIVFELYTLRRKAAGLDKLTDTGLED